MHGSFRLAFPTRPPGAEAIDGGAAGVGLLNQFGLLQTGLLGAFEFGGHIAQLVRPATL